MIRRIILQAVLLLGGVCTYAMVQQIPLGQFQAHDDIGPVENKGDVQFNPADSSYTITGAGANMWFETDEFHFLWKQMRGDLSIAADISWLGEGVDPHRKACLMVRQSLEADAPYADVALHGDGLTSLQYREVKGGPTREIQSGVRSPKRVRLEKSGAYISMSLSGPDSEMVSAGGSFRLEFKEPFYLGMGVCSHNPAVKETARFAAVEIKPLPVKEDSLKKLESSLEIIDITSLDRKVVYRSDTHLEAPNWTPDGSSLIFNSEGLLYRIPVAGGSPEQIPTGFARRINNDHGISPDGTQIVISDQTETGKSLIYTLPFTGGDPVKITEKGPSYWHGWSPDGKTLAYCAERNGNYDIYTIPVAGGEEKRLTTAAALDDGPDYSPDGQYIYFNSARTGTMQIWRMHTDGSGQEQLSSDKYHDWFAHPSPDGQWIAYVSFGTDVPADQHPPNKDVMLRLMNLNTGEVQTMAKLFGGQGTINVPSWAPDSSKLAFVSYRLN